MYSKEQLERLYEESSSVREVAEKIGVNMRTLYSRFERLGIRRRPLPETCLKLYSKEQLERLYEECRSVREVAERIGVKERTLSARFRRLGIRKRSVRETWEKTHSKESLELLYRETRNVSEVARQLGAPYGTVYAWFVRLGIERLPRTVVFAERNKRRGAVLPDDEIRQLRLDGWSVERLCDRFGVTKMVMRRALTRLGVYKRSDGKRRAWRGGELRKNGYVWVYRPEHPRARPGKPYVKRSHLVWEEAHRMRLPEGVVIHHKNGIKDDDRPENLQAMSIRAHSRLTLKDVRPDVTLKRRIAELEAEIAALKGTREILGL